MYGSNPNENYQKFPPPSAPPPGPPPYPYAQPAPPQYSSQYVTGTPVLPAAPSDWSTGLCDCSSDVSNCCITCWCPCITFGQIAEIVDQGSTSCGVHGALYTLLALLTGCGCIYSCIYRSKMRKQYMLHEEPCNDCLVHCCCEACALCQEYRELKHRGFDMSIGWEGNMARPNRGGIAMPPIVHGGMTR